MNRSRLARPAPHTDEAAAVDRLRARVAVGAPVGRLDGVPGRVARALALATEVGAPAQPALAAAVDAVAADRARGRAATVATAQARAVAVALALLPVVGVPGLAAVLDRPLLGFYATPGGRVVGAFGVALAAGGVLLTRVLTTRLLRPPDVAHDEVHDLVATAMTAGMSPGAGVRAAARHLPARAAELHSLALGLDLGAPLRPADELAPLLRVLEASATWGAPAAPALRRLAHDLRADERARVAAAAERLPALLTFPTVLFLLPASLLLVGAPVLASGLEVVSGT